MTGCLSDGITPSQSLRDDSVHNGEETDISTIYKISNKNRVKYNWGQSFPLGHSPGPSPKFKKDDFNISGIRVVRQKVFLPI